MLDILEHLGSAQPAVKVSELARATGLNVSTAFRLLQTLMARGYVEQDREQPRLCPRTPVLPDRKCLSARQRPSDDCPAYLEALRDAVGETAYLVIFSRGEIVQLCKADGKQAVSASVRSMVREPAYCTATGKVLLAGLAPEELDDYMATVELQVFTPQTIVNKTTAAQGDRQGSYAAASPSIRRSLCRTCAA